jgi:hypothetical protein
MDRHFPPPADRLTKATATARKFPLQQIIGGPDYVELENKIDKLWLKMRATDREMRKILEAEKNGENVKEAILQVQLKYIKQNLQMIELARSRSKAYDDWKGKSKRPFMAFMSPSFVISSVISGHGAEEEGRRRGKQR